MTCGLCGKPAWNHVEDGDNWTEGWLCDRHADHAARCGATVTKVQPPKVDTDDPFLAVL